MHVWADIVSKLSYVNIFPSILGLDGLKAQILESLTLNCISCEKKFPKTLKNPVFSLCKICAQ